MKSLFALFAIAISPLVAQAQSPPSYVFSFENGQSIELYQETPQFYFHELGDHSYWTLKPIPQWRLTYGVNGTAPNSPERFWENGFGLLPSTVASEWSQLPSNLDPNIIANYGAIVGVVVVPEPSGLFCPLIVALMLRRKR